MEVSKISGRGFMVSKVHKTKKLKAKNLKKIYENKLAVLNKFKEKYKQNMVSCIDENSAITNIVLLGYPPNLDKENE